MVSDKEEVIARIKNLGCLNPCSNGIWSLTSCEVADTVYPEGLNPCSNGIWSLTIVSDTEYYHQ